MSSQWSKWWWLRLHQGAAWSAEERSAAGAFGLAFLGVLLLIGLCGFRLVWGVGFSIQTSLVASILLGFLLAILNARGIASEVAPNIVTRGDDAAARRLGGSVVLPPEEFFIRKLWWLDWRYTHRWSDEEQWTRNAICGLASVLFIVPVALELRILADHGFSKRDAALTLVFIQLPLTFYLSRLICVWLWPDYVKRADDNAVRRSNRNILPRP
jgi:hypothetical protein